MFLLSIPAAYLKHCHANAFLLSVPAAFKQGQDPELQPFRMTRQINNLQNNFIFPAQGNPRPCGRGKLNYSAVVVATSVSVARPP